MQLILTLVTGLLLTACTTATKKTSSENSNNPEPKLLAPSVRKVWIPAKAKDGGQEWEEGHYLYRIERGTSWSR